MSDCAGAVQAVFECLKTDDIEGVRAAAADLGRAADDADPDVCKAGVRALFADVVEPLNDALDAAGRQGYAAVFPAALWAVIERHAPLKETLKEFGITSLDALQARYDLVRQSSSVAVTGSPRRIGVLSRVTIGADVLLASVVIGHLRKAWPDAQVVLFGDKKLAPLFTGDPQVSVQAIAYRRRGSLGERIETWLGLIDQIAGADLDLLIGPDSRLDQLGILPLGPAEQYRLWENLQPGPEPQSLARILDAWCGRICGTGPGINPQLHLDGPTAALGQHFSQSFGAGPLLAVKLDYGGNDAKRLPRPAEVAILQQAVVDGWRLVLDRGFGDEELAESDDLLQQVGLKAFDIDDSGKGFGIDPADLKPGQCAQQPVIRFHGSIAGWAAAVSACQGALSYDSVGHHLAAALSVPLVTAFTGHPSAAFPVAWQAMGPAQRIQVLIPNDQRSEIRWAHEVVSALQAIKPSIQ